VGGLGGGFWRVREARDVDRWKNENWERGASAVADTAGGNIPLRKRHDSTAIRLREQPSED